MQTIFKFHDNRYRLISRTLCGLRIVKVIYAGEWVATHPTMIDAVLWAEQHSKKLTIVEE